MLRGAYFSVKVTACLVSRATRRAEKRSVIRRTAFAVPRRPRQSGRQLADDGLRPLPPYAYASFIIGGGRWP
ncbi:DNA helicase UvrD [Thioalkalivibrio paradoxus]|uniref:DNA helicase UvrD n=1 Tax=Thioalkalivibrio paradoxus TaxID=108010 RepID=UPI0009FD9CF8|nr:DNA helicase UvrD [Thioalkalivibrio paradoxus]